MTSTDDSSLLNSDEMQVVTTYNLDQWGMGFLFPMSFEGYDEQAYLNVRLTIKKKIFTISERNAPNCLRLACLCYWTVLKLCLILFYCLKWFIIKTSRKNLVSLTRINKLAKAEKIRIKFCANYVVIKTGKTKCYNTCKKNHNPIHVYSIWKNGHELD